MIKTTQEMLLDEFAAIAGRGSSGVNAINAWVQAPLASAGSALASQGATAGAGAAGDDGGITVGSVAKTVLESGLGLVPLIGGLIGLFSGGDSSEPPPPVKYAMPAPVEFEAAETEGRLTGVSYDQMGAPRASRPGPANRVPTEHGAYGAGVQGGTDGPPAQITVQVQAMDSRSFMDHSAEIAAAVRNAMLNLNSINDVVNDL